MVLRTGCVRQTDRQTGRAVGGEVGRCVEQMQNTSEHHFGGRGWRRREDVCCPGGLQVLFEIGGKVISLAAIVSIVTQHLEVAGKCHMLCVCHVYIRARLIRARRRPLEFHMHGAIVALTSMYESIVPLKGVYSYIGNM